MKNKTITISYNKFIHIKCLGGKIFYVKQTPKFLIYEKN